MVNLVKKNKKCTQTIVAIFKQYQEFATNQMARFCNHLHL